MQKGRFVRAAPPYTASEDNWPGAFRPYLANKYDASGTFTYAFFPRTFTAVRTGACLHPFGPLSFEWKFQFSIGVEQILGILLIEPTTTGPPWDVGWRLADEHGGTLLATYRGPQVVVLPQDFFNETMWTLLTHSSSGSFGPAIPTWQVVGVNYPVE